MCRRHTKALGVERNGEAIELVPVHSALDTGISYRVMVPGMVARYEEDAARVAAGYTLPAWEAIGCSGRAREIAHYRARHYVEMHVQDAGDAAIKRMSHRPGR